MRSMAALNSSQIEVTVADSNDNAPRFVYEDGIIQDQYLVAVADDTPSDTDIFSVKVSEQYHLRAESLFTEVFYRFQGCRP